MSIAGDAKPLKLPESIEEAHERIACWAEAWNRGDIESVIAHFNDYATFTSPVAAQIIGHPIVRGKTGLRHYWTTALHRIGSLRFSILNVFWDATGNELLVVYSAELGGTCKHACERMRLDSAGLVIEAEAFYGGVCG